MALYVAWKAITFAQVHFSIANKRVKECNNSPKILRNVFFFVQLSNNKQNKNLRIPVKRFTFVMGFVYPCPSIQNTFLYFLWILTYAFFSSAIMYVSGSKLDVLWKSTGANVDNQYFLHGSRIMTWGHMTFSNILCG